MSDIFTIIEYTAIIIISMSPCYLCYCYYKNRLILIDNDTLQQSFQEKNNKTYEI